MNTQSTTSQYKILGTTGDVTTCGCCGRDDLKKTVALKRLDGGDVVYFGTACAARALGWTVKVAQQAIRRANTSKKAAEEQRQREIAWDISHHPLMLAIDTERAAFYNQVPRPSFADSLPLRPRWSEMEAQARSEVLAAWSAKEAA